jgi:hypothetical protein
MSASRRAFQKLDLECKKTAAEVLRRISTKESQRAMMHLQVAEKLSLSVSSISTDKDAMHFVSNYTVTPERGALTLCSQALSLLDDLSPQPSVLEKAQFSEKLERDSTSGTTSGCNTPRGSITSTRSARNSVHSDRANNGNLAGDMSIDTSASTYFDPVTGAITESSGSSGKGSHMIRPPPLKAVPSPPIVFVDDWARRAKSRDNTEFTEHLCNIFYSEAKQQQEEQGDTSQRDGPSSSDGADAHPGSSSQPSEASGRCRSSSSGGSGSRNSSISNSSVSHSHRNSGSSSSGSSRVSDTIYGSVGHNKVFLKRTCRRWSGCASR